MFLSQDDVAIANQLKGIYGNDVPAALASSEASALRLNTAFRGLSSSIENDMVNGLTNIVSGQESVGKGAQDMAAQFVRAIEQMIIKITIVEPLLTSMQSLISGSGIMGFLGLGGAPGVNASGGINGANRRDVGQRRAAGLPECVGQHLLGRPYRSVRRWRRRRRSIRRADGAVRRGRPRGDHAAAPRPRWETGCRGGRGGWVER
jgi:hypothetical protein